MNTMRSWYEEGIPAFLLRLAAVGAFAGLVSWVAVYAAHLLLGSPRPSTVALLWAIPRGAFFGVVLGLILTVYWSRRKGEDDLAA